MSPSLTNLNDPTKHSYWFDCKFLVNQNAQTKIQQLAGYSFKIGQVVGFTTLLYIFSPIYEPSFHCYIKEK